MFNWAKNAHVRSITRVLPGQNANGVYCSVGISEPIYGPSAIQSVGLQAKETPYTELEKDDLRWEVMDSTNVETKTFYITTDEGQLALVQIIYSNVMGIHTTSQFNTKVFSQSPGNPHLWSSDQLSNTTFSPDKLHFKADNCTLDLSPDGRTYHIRSSTNKQSIVDISITQSAPSIVIGKNGTTSFGTDPAKPWGRMRHAFWPRCSVSGTILTQQGPVDMKGRGMFSHALQGMKPHFAAAKWNFANFQSKTYSAVMMEFTTPESYGHTSVNVGCIATEGAILFAGAEPDMRLTHTETEPDSENAWPEPRAVTYTWQGVTKEGKEASAELSGELGTRTDRVDVMGEVPKFVKQIVAGAAGTKPYIYQYCPVMELRMKVGGQEEVREKGTLLAEATFIS